MGGCRWWQWNNSCFGVIVGGSSKIMVGHGWWQWSNSCFGVAWMVAAKLWLVVAGRGSSHDLVIPLMDIWFKRVIFFKMRHLFNQIPSSSKSEVTSGHLNNRSSFLILISDNFYLDAPLMRSRMAKYLTIRDWSYGGSELPG